MYTHIHIIHTYYTYIHTITGAVSAGAQQASEGQAALSLSWSGRGIVPGRHRENPTSHHRSPYPRIIHTYIQYIHTLRAYIHTELERQRKSIILVCHLAVLRCVCKSSSSVVVVVVISNDSNMYVCMCFRCVYAYFTGVSLQDIPFKDFKFHHIYELSPGE